MAESACLGGLLADGTVTAFLAGRAPASCFGAAETVVEEFNGSAAFGGPDAIPGSFGFPTIGFAGESTGAAVFGRVPSFTLLGVPTGGTGGLTGPEVLGGVSNLTFG